MAPSCSNIKTNVQGTNLNLFKNRVFLVHFALLRKGLQIVTCSSHYLWISHCENTPGPYQGSARALYTVSPVLYREKPTWRRERKGAGKNKPSLKRELWERWKKVDSAVQHQHQSAEENSHFLHQLTILLSRRPMAQSPPSWAEED